MRFPAAPDDQELTIIRRDFSGGMNTRQHASKISETQVENLSNWDIEISAQTNKCKGIALLKAIGTAGTGSLGFMPRAGTNEILVTYGTNLAGCTNPVETGSATFTVHKNDFTTGLPTNMIKVSCSGSNGDVVLVSNGTDNIWQMTQAYAFTDLADTNTSPPKTTVMTFYRNRAWFLWHNGLYWSLALPSTYLAQCDRTSNYYGVTVGQERALIGLRDVGLIALGADAVYGINPSTTPAATDLAEKILDIGCAAGNTACQVADDVFFLANDGVRGVFRTQQDKLQMGQSFPLSYPLKTEYETINWAQISKACAIWYQNRYLLALPVNSSTYNNQVWVFYPARNSWAVIDGWNVASWSKILINGEERIYYIDSVNGSVYRAFQGLTNNGTAITSTFIGREEDGGKTLQYKNGGEIEIEAEVAGSGNMLTIDVSIDGKDFQNLGSISLTSGTAPTLPINLPFTLSDSYIVRKKLHLDSLGRWRTIQVKITNTDSNTDPIILYGYSIATFVEEYLNE